MTFYVVGTWVLKTQNFNFDWNWKSNFLQYRYSRFSGKYSVLCLSHEFLLILHIRNIIYHLVCMSAKFQTFISQMLFFILFVYYIFSYILRDMVYNPNTIWCCVLLSSFSITFLTCWLIPLNYYLWRPIYIFKLYSHLHFISFLGIFSSL